MLRALARRKARQIGAGRASLTVQSLRSMHRCSKKRGSSERELVKEHLRPVTRARPSHHSTPRSTTRRARHHACSSKMPRKWRPPWHSKTCCSACEPAQARQEYSQQQSVRCLLFFSSTRMTCNICKQNKHRFLCQMRAYFAFRINGISTAPLPLHCCCDVFLFIAWMERCCSV